MSDPAILEGDTVHLFCPEAKGFVFAQPPSSSYSHVTIFPVSNSDSSTHPKDPALPNVHFASFQVLAENAEINLNKTSPLDVPRKNQETFLRRSLVYGRKIKLLHVASKMYLSLESTDSLNRAATLVTGFDKETCLFRILPSRPGKHRGEDVLSHDQIKLESVSEKGHHILCASNTITSRYELKMAVTDSMFVISSLTTIQSRVPPKALRGCDVVMLFSFKREAYLAGRGSIVTEVLPDDVKELISSEVGARKRESVHGIQKAPPISGDCFWQLEKADSPLNGDQFKYGEQCRIKHLPTQEYLAVQQRGQIYQLTLKKRDAGMPLVDAEIAFSLVSVTGQTGGVRKGSYVELRHVQSGKNLSVLSKSYLLQRTFSSPNIEPTSQTKWFQLGLEDSDQSKQQYFHIEEVNSDLIHEYYHVSGVSAVLKEYMEKFTADPKPVPFPPALDEPLQVLKRLSEWLFEGDQYQKGRANMLRVSQAIDLLIGFLYESEGLHDYQELKTMCGMISAVLLRYVESSNKKSHLYLAEERFMDVMFSKIGQGIGIEKVLSTLVKDESSITERVVNRLTQNSDFSQRILHSLDASILDFLSTLCFTAGKPVRNLQDVIREQVIVKGEVGFIRTKVENGVVCFSSPEQIKGPLANIFSKGKKLSNANKKMFDFFVAQLRLFSRVCKGVNITSIDFMCKEKKFVTFEEALICINDSDLHPLLQSVYLDFVTSAYVDLNVEQSGTDIDNIWHSFYWDQISHNPMQAVGVADTFDAIPQKDEIRALQRSIRTYLSENKVLYATDEGQNELLAQMLAVMEPLVSYGFYWKNEEINEITKFLIDIVDGKHDRPGPNASSERVVKYQQKKRYKASEKNQKVFYVKTRAVRILHLMFKMSVYVTLGKLMYDFKFLKLGLEVGPEDDYSPPCSSLSALLNIDYQLCDQESQITCIASRRLRELFTENSYKTFDMNESEGQILIKILIDLLKYEDDELRLCSILLLFDIFQEENILFRDASISYVVTPPSLDVFREMLIKGCFGDESKCLLKLLQGTAFEKPDGEDNAVYEDAVATLEIVRDVCIIEDDETQTHDCNQGIVFSSGVFSAVLSYILQYCCTLHEEQIPLIELSCSALQRVVRKNDQVQKKIFTCFTDFLEVKIAVAPVARLLTETLSDNPGLCRKLSEADIRQIYTIAATATVSDYCEFFTVLETVMKPSKCNGRVLLKKYQELVSRTVSEHRHEHFVKILGSEQGAQERMRLLKEVDDDDTSLLQLIALSDLLATAAEGQCKYSEDICQSIYSLEELVDIISDPTIELDRKKPFARLLNWGYLNTERDSLVSIAVLSKNSQFWAHLERFSVLMNIFSDQLTHDDDQTELIKVKTRILFTQHSSFTAWKERNEEFDANLECDDKVVSLSSFLCYLIDGLIPLVTSFCAQLASHTSSGLTSKTYSSLLTPPIVAVLKTVSDSIVKLVTNHPAVLLTTIEQVNYWTKCMDVLVFMLPLEQNVALNEARETALSNEDFFTSPGVTEYETELKDERMINEEFQRFVANFKLTYEGSTRNSQMETYDNIIHDDEDELIPPGTSFRELVKLFTDEITDNTRELVKAKCLLELMNILFRHLQQPLTSKERADLDYVLLTSLQVLCGVVHTKIDSIDPQLQVDNPELFEKEYEDKVKPLQDALVEMRSHEKVMIHLSHPADDIAVHVLAFLRVLLYFGNENAQTRIGRLTKHRDSKFFLRLNKLLDSVISSIGQPLSRALRVEHQYSITDSVPAPPTDPPLPLASVPIERPIEEGEGGVNIPLQPQGSFQRLIIEEIEEVNVRERTLSTSTEGDIAIVEETDFGAAPFKRTIRTYTVEGAGQLETSATDAKKRASVVLDVVAWICDGQNSEMQNILRKQESAFTNANIVGAVAVLFQTLAEHFSDTTIRSTKKAIQALIEMCAGNFTNQEVAFKGQIVDSVNIILRCNSSNQPTLEASAVELMRVKASALELLEVMIEETNENSKSLAQGVSQDLSVPDVMETMREFWRMSQDDDALEAEAEKAIFRAYHVLKKIADYMDTTVDAYVKFDEYCDDDEMDDLWIHLKDYSRSIEVNYITQNEDEILTRVYFPFNPSKALTEDERIVIKNNIKRDSPEDKVKDLLEWSESVRKNVRHKNKIRSKLYLRWAVFGSTIRHIILSFLTLLLNFFVIILFEVPDNVGNNTSNYTIITDPSIPKWFSSYLLYILGAFHFILALWMLSEYFVREAPNLLFQFPLFSQVLYDIKKWSDRYEILRRLRSIFGKAGAIKKPVSSQCFEVYFLSFAPLYRILFVLCSIAALGTHGYFYCGCILYVFLKNDVLHQVLTAVRRSAVQLISVGLLGLGILLIFAVISFVFLHNFFDVNEEKFCRTMIECYVSVIREGLLDTLGTMIPLEYVGQPEPSFTVYWARAIFDIIFFIVVTTLGLNIVVAILVDRFSELRSERDDIKKDKLNYCFLCGIDNDTFERKAKGFRRHVLNDHNMWNYIYFQLHLDSLYTNDHNALEKYVNDNIQGRTIGFFPLRKAKVLGGRVSDSAVQPS